MGSGMKQNAQASLTCLQVCGEACLPGWPKGTLPLSQAHYYDLLAAGRSTTRRAVTSQLPFQMLTPTPLPLPFFSNEETKGIIREVLRFMGRVYFLVPKNAPSVCLMWGNRLRQSKGQEAKLQGQTLGTLK